MSANQFWSDRELSAKEQGMPSGQEISVKYLKYSVEYLKGATLSHSTNSNCTELCLLNIITLGIPVAFYIGML